jgi:SnoaL-like domain
MNAIEVVRRYNQAWNGRDAEALVALFAEGGTYSNPDAGQGLTGEAIGTFAKGVWAAFPDMTLELVSVRETGRAKSPISGCCVAPTADR